MRGIASACQVDTGDTPEPMNGRHEMLLLIALRRNSVLHVTTAAESSVRSARHDVSKAWEVQDWQSNEILAKNKGGSLEVLNPKP